MFKRLTRQQLHALVWETPMTKLAAEFGLSDVALHKICRKHRVPTPPAGYWAKKAHGKRVTTTPLPDPRDKVEIVIREGSSMHEPEAVVEARALMLATLQAPAPTALAPNVIVERTLTKLGKTRKGADGLVRSQTDVRMAVRAETLERAGAILRTFVSAGEQTGLRLVKGDEGASWLFDGETIAFEVVEVADQVEHVAMDEELAAVAKWKREREDHHRRYGYWRDWGEPKIPKWEQRFQGRLAIKLEEVRVQSEQSWWGNALRRTFSDTRTRNITKVIPQAVGAVAAIAAAKKHNRTMEARRRADEEEAARRRAEAERRRVLEQRASELLNRLLETQVAAERLRALIAQLARETQGHPRTAAFVRWAEGRLARLDAQFAGAALEQQLADAVLFVDGSNDE